MGTPMGLLKNMLFAALPHEVNWKERPDNFLWLWNTWIGLDSAIGGVGIRVWNYSLSFCCKSFSSPSSSTDVKAAVFKHVRDCPHCLLEGGSVLLKLWLCSSGALTHQVPLHFFTMLIQYTFLRAQVSTLDSGSTGVRG